MLFKDKYRRVQKAVVKAADKVIDGDQRPRKSKALRIIKFASVPLLVFVIIFAVYQVTRHVTVGMNTLRTQEITDVSYVSLDLHIFRDEHLIGANDGTLIRYSSPSGEKIGVNDVIGEIYKTEGLTAEELRSRQELLNSFTSRLQTLESTGAGTLSDIKDTSAEIDRSYTGMLQAASDGNMSVLEGFAKDMLIGLEKHAALTGSQGESAITSDKLNASIDALLSDATPTEELKTDTGGYFYREVDGYESAYPYASAMTMTAGEFFAMRELPASNTDGYYGKLVTTPQWYAAAYVSFADASSFETGVTYSMQLTDNAYDEIKMELVRAERDEEGVLLVFSSMMLPSQTSLERTLSVRTVCDSVDGYRVPESALIQLTHEDLTYDAVYVLEGNVVECRIVHILREYNGYCIVKTAEAAKADEAILGENPTPWARLSQNDKIITSGGGLYEGKIIS